MHIIWQVQGGLHQHLKNVPCLMDTASTCRVCLYAGELFCGLFDFLLRYVTSWPVAVFSAPVRRWRHWPSLRSLSRCVIVSRCGMHVRFMLAELLRFADYLVFVCVCVSLFSRFSRRKKLPTSKACILNSGHLYDLEQLERVLLEANSANRQQMIR